MRLHKDAKTELLRSIALFADCTRDELREVEAVADEIDLREGRLMAVENDEGREVVVIVSGTAEVRRGDEVVATLGAGDWFGEIAVLTGKPRTATVIATAPVRALVIESHRFQQLLEHAPEIRAKVERVLAERMG